MTPHAPADRTARCLLAVAALALPSVAAAIGVLAATGVAVALVGVAVALQRTFRVAAWRAVRNADDGRRPDVAPVASAAAAVPAGPATADDAPGVPAGPAPASHASAFAARAHFVATVSRELRGPMNGVMGMTALLLDTPLSAEQRELAETIRASAEGLLDSLHEILDFARLEAGALVLEQAEFEVRPAIEAVVELLAERAHAKGLALDAAVDAAVPERVAGDVGRVRQVVRHLLENAVAWTERGRVTVGVTIAEETDDDVVLRVAVTDTGCGVRPEDQPRLFQSFPATDAGDGGRRVGTGLGLAIAAQLVARMGGTIGVDSAVGEGATLWFTARLGRQVAAPAREASATPAVRGLRVLLLVTDVALRAQLLEQLDTCGAEAHALPDLERACASLTDRRTPYRAVIIDLPRDGGDPLAAALAVRQVAALPVLLVAPLGRRLERARLRAAGIAHVVTRPVRQAHLEAALTAISANHPAPAPAPAPPPRAPAAAAASGGQQALGLQVLVAEDNPVNQRVVLALLKRFGCRADTAANGREAVEAFARAAYDVVLMDCQMPEMDGYEATRTIRARETDGRRIPIIAVTANAMPGDRERCLESGMDDYIAKPVRPQLLEAALLRWCPRRDEREDEAAPAVDPAVLSELGTLARETGDPGLLDRMVAHFLAGTDDGCARLRAALDASNAGEVVETTHRLHGGAASLGAEALASLAQRMSQLGAEAALDQARAILPQLERELARVCEALQRHRGPAAAAASASCTAESTG